MEANRILVVEDDKDIREGIEIYLRNQGYVVFQAGDGVEGLQVIMQEEIHLAIVDSSSYKSCNLFCGLCLEVLFLTLI